MADLKQLARRIFHETLAAIDIPLAMQRKLVREGSLLRCGAAAIDLSQFESVRVVAIGKAAHAMLDGLRACLPRDLSFAGIASAPVRPAKPHSAIEYFVSGHPIPNEDSWNVAKAILEMLWTCNSQTLVFFLLSGGGSALVELPLDPLLNLADMHTPGADWLRRSHRSHQHRAQTYFSGKRRPVSHCGESRHKNYTGSQRCPRRKRMGTGQRPHVARPNHVG
jgi:glycerate-2-kinase